ncbi:serine protease [Aliiglaciecola litoralis]|uniref:Trypsin-like peptidase domain-containing protein n=1 Tax=Aliiglaciecola litoralis TaxID=582857 RepID=A0ABP3X4C1_9ALTE
MKKYQIIKGALTRALFASLLVLIVIPAQAKLDSKEMHYSVVRIEVEDGPVVSMASGFVWQKNNWVITSLHAIKRKPARISVFCRDVPVTATVEKVLRKADLVLLKTVEPLENCNPINNLNPNAPDDFSRLIVFGFKPDVTSSKANSLEKLSSESDKLRHNITSEMLPIMTKVNMPSLDLSIYLVSSGIFKGFSGGPVFDQQGALRGVVEGGLDKGLSNHNWLIPAKYINELIESPSVDDIPDDLNDEDYYFSAVVVKRSAPQNYIEYEDEDNQYRWIKTKTRTFEQLRQTSDPADGLEELWATILPDIETSAEKNLAFDIYEEEELGIVIAIPAGNKLQYIEEDGDWTLAATDSTKDQAFITIRHGAYFYEDANGNRISASHDEFFDYAIGDDLNCEAPVTCELEEEHFRVVDYGSGNIVFRVGYVFEDSSDDTSMYVYKNRIVKGDDVLIVETVINLDKDSTVVKCFEAPSPENCGKTFWEPASFMLAAAMTRFANLSVEGIVPVVYTPDDEDSPDEYEDSEYDDSEYDDSEYDDSAPPQTIEEEGAQDAVSSTSYLSENGETFFVQYGGERWFVNIEGVLQEASIQSYETFDNGVDYVILGYQGSFYAVPIYGGGFLIASPEGQWTEGQMITPYAQD